MLKKSQWKLSLGFWLFILLLILLLLQVSVQLTLIFAVSLAIGFTMQKSRFCFVSAFRDPLLVGTTKLTEALLLLLAISIPGFAILSGLLDLPLTLYVTPFGFPTLIGGILFGMGMVLAGGCASGVLMRIGEGMAMQMLALLGIFIGVFLGKFSLPYWLAIFHQFPGIFLPDIMGWGPAVAVQLLLLFFLWKVTRWWQKKQKGIE